MVSGRKVCNHHGLPREESKTYQESLEDGLPVIDVVRYQA